MPTYVGLGQQGFFEPFQILQQGIIAGQQRRLREKELAQSQQQIGLQTEAGQRAGEELGIRKQEFNLQQPVLSEKVRQTKNTQAVQSVLNANPPSGFFNTYTPQERVSRLQQLKQAGFSGDPNEFRQAHDELAQGMFAPTGGQLMMGLLGQRGAGNESSDTGGGSPGVQVTPPATGTPGPNTPANPLGPRVTRPTTDMNKAALGGATGAGGIPPTGVGDVGGTGGTGAPGASGALPLPKPPVTPPLGFRLVPKMSEKGQPGIGFENQPPSLTPDIQSAVRKDPSTVYRLPDYMQPEAEKYLGNFEKATKDIQDQLEKSPDVGGFIGSKDKGGTRANMAKMNAVLSSYGDPSSSSFNWAKVNPVDAFSLIYNDAQSNNPGAIVRPSDVENLKSLQGYTDRMKVLGQMLSGQGQKMGPEVKRELYHVAAKRAAQQEQMAMRAFGNIEKRANRYQVPLEDLVDSDFLDSYKASQGAGLPQVGGAPKVSRPGAVAPNGPISVSTEAAIRALPKGAPFIWAPTGRRGTKN